MATTPNTPEKNNQSADLPNNPTTNEEILALLRQLVNEKSSNEANGTEQNDPFLDKTILIPGKLPKDTEKPITLDDDADEDDICSDDEDDEDDDDDGLEVLGYLAGGAALVGFGALLYHWLKD